MLVPAKPTALKCAQRYRLASKVQYFLRSSRLGRREVGTFISEATERGRLFIVGGMLRDLALSDNRAFSSDIDFVIQGADIGELKEWLSTKRATPNRFGGYGVGLERWKVDIWPLERSWAHLSGHREVREPRDLLFATFFDWDSVLFDVQHRSIICPDDYFERIAQRVLDIQLPQNPNPLGNAIRALRYAYRWKATFGPNLATHVLRQITDSSWQTMLEIERKSFSRKYLPNIDADQTLIALRLFEASGRQGSVRIVALLRQPSLF